jgi:hypothetical protein
MKVFQSPHLRPRTVEPKRDQIKRKVREENFGVSITGAREGALLYLLRGFGVR